MAAARAREEAARAATEVEMETSRAARARAAAARAKGTRAPGVVSWVAMEIPRVLVARVLKGAERAGAKRGWVAARTALAVVMRAVGRGRGAAMEAVAKAAVGHQAEAWWAVDCAR